MLSSGCSLASHQPYILFFLRSPELVAVLREGEIQSLLRRCGRNYMGKKSPSGHAEFSCQIKPRAWM